MARTLSKLILFSTLLVCFAQVSWAEDAPVVIPKGGSFASKNSSSNSSTSNLFSGYMNKKNKNNNSDSSSNSGLNQVPNKNPGSTGDTGGFGSAPIMGGGHSKNDSAPASLDPGFFNSSPSLEGVQIPTVRGAYDPPTDNGVVRMHGERGAYDPPSDNGVVRPGALSPYDPESPGRQRNTRSYIPPKEKLFLSFPRPAERRTF